MHKPHKKLDAWKLAIELTTTVYQITDHFPKRETFGLTQQLRRAAVGIPSNIAEGAARKGKREFIQFLHTARGSLSELDTQIELARRLGYLDAVTWENLEGLMKRVDMTIAGLLRAQNNVSRLPSPV